MYDLRKLGYEDTDLLKDLDTGEIQTAAQWVEDLDSDSIVEDVETLLSLERVEGADINLDEVHVSATYPIPSGGFRTGDYTVTYKETEFKVFSSVGIYCDYKETEEIVKDDFLKIVDHNYRKKRAIA